MIINKVVKALITSGLLLSFTSYAQTSLISNVSGYSVNDGVLKPFSAIAFEGDKVLKLYGKDEALPKKEAMVYIDGEGQTMLPGLIDAHGHVLSYGLSLMRAQLRGAESENEAVKRVKHFRDAQPELNWVQGRGWNQVLWPSKSFPSAKSLDKIFPDTPVWLIRIDGHAGWANSAAMTLSNINAQTQSPEGGEIIRDASGEPTGVFIDKAMALISQNIPSLTQTEQRAVLKLSMKELSKLGLTSVHDAGVGNDTLEAYLSLAKADEMPIRIYGMLDADDRHFSELMKQGPIRLPEHKLDIASVKLSADGALGSRGAALIEDYSDQKGNSGLLLYPEGEMAKVMKLAMESGFQVNTHAIGDQANKLVLDNYQELIKETNTGALRHRIEHAQVLRLEDIPRFAKLNVIASMQATHATSDKNMALDRLGSERIKGAYAWRKLLESGAVIAAGSDFPIESANPFFGLHASVTRQDQQNRPENGWYGDQSMTLTQALNSFTQGAAYAAHQESLIGQLKPGMKADFILVDQDIFAIPASELWQTQVNQTWINGKRIY
ncbi:amidohydrolase [Shewanella sp. NR704-98]|uniref:Amidohydrolase n=1 Tax=Shewanella nanhaiensis TaxID=2864872 RepID=A0ABS7E8V9_9GAMM|nr:amidohydrolase [Shewanella nanhaiensis]MBW8185596.1 amidohydrolase [Shewanella nanhaiensis]